MKKKEILPKKDKAIMTAWGEPDSDDEQERSFLGCFMAKKEVTFLSELSKDDLVKLIMKLKLCLDNYDEQINEKDMIIS